jgi:ferredoxin-NADP reductase/DMSO/TMAO reductase YedYZ heme-binding membrane subunit
VRTIDQAPRASPLLDATFLRRFAAATAVVPLVMLGWDACRDRLGPNGIGFALHTTGLVGLLLLLVSLAVTPLRRLTGWNTLIALRRPLGLYACLYLCVHFAVFYGFDRASSIRDTLHEVLMRRYLQIGALGLGLMLLLAATSVSTVVTRLGPRRWKRLHRLVYLAAVLGSVHYCLSVKADLRQPLVLAGVLAGLLAVRVTGLAKDGRTKSARRGTPAVPARSPRPWTGALQVVKIIQETPDVRTFRLAPEVGDELPFTHRPGQYLNLALTIDGIRVNRSYTIASSPARTSFCELTVKRKSDGHASIYLHDVLREGATLQVSAPLGRFVFAGGEASKVLLVAGGVGVTPVMAMLRYLTDSSWPGQIYFLFSVRQRRDIVFSKEIDSLQRRFPNLHVSVTLSDERDSAWVGERGRITSEMLQRFVPDVRQFPVYLCGPAPMMAGTRGILRDLGVAERQIQVEAFTPVAPAVAMPRAAGDNTVPHEEVAQSRDLAGGSVPTIHFKRSGTTADLPGGSTILEAAEQAGVDLLFECRAGICGQCKTRLLAGQVTMDVEDALSAEEKSNGFILACQARSVRDVAVDA